MGWRGDFDRKVRLDSVGEDVPTKEALPMDAESAEFQASRCRKVKE